VVTDPHDLTALEQAAAIRAGELSPVELVSHYLDRIGRLDAELGAFLTITADQALEQARAATDLVTAHRGEAGALPPLLGVPTAIKDLTATAGVRTTYGSRAFASHVPGTDAHVVTALRAAGTISLGKTNTPEFGLGPYTDNDLRGPARTPWDPLCSAGGSSGGAAAAVAGGLVPVAHGSDGGGSVRIPASVCGLVGLKPSRGRVSSAPDASVHGRSVHGVLARSVADAAAMLDALAGPVPGDPWWAPPLPGGETFLRWAGADPGRLRIGRYVTPAAGTEVDPACVAAWHEASALLTSLGHEVQDIETPFPLEIGRFFARVWAVLSLGPDLPADDESLLRPVTRSWREHGRKVTGAQHAAAMAGMQLAARRSVAATAEFDAVLTPTLGLPPQPVGFFAEDGDPRENLRRQTLFTPFTAAYNMTGQPVVSLPLRWTAGGLPIGVSLAGRPAGEAPLLALSAQLEAASPWADRRPACW
jgi:amidase